MTIQELIQLKRECIVVDWSLHEPNKSEVWKFLREDVHTSQNSAICGRCGVEEIATYGSSYNAMHPGWCIYCVLFAFFSNMSKLDDEIDGFHRGFPFYRELWNGDVIG